MELGLRLNGLTKLILQPLGGWLGPVGEDDVGAGAAEAGVQRTESVPRTGLSRRATNNKRADPLPVVCHFTLVLL